MKKFLLLAGLAIYASSVKANDYFDVYYNGELVENGSTITNVMKKEVYEFGTTSVTVREYNCDIVIKSKKSTAVQGYAVAQGINPTTADWKAATNGSFSICFANGGVNGDENNCLLSSDASTLYTTSVVIPANSENFEWQMHIQNVPSDIDNSVAVAFYMSDTTGDNAPKADASKFDLNINFVADNSAVEAIGTDNAAAEYFDIQGRRVTNPEAGLYIVRRGNKVSKELIR